MAVYIAAQGRQPSKLLLVASIGRKDLFGYQLKPLSGFT
jgi:hypothetical protein